MNHSQYLLFSSIINVNFLIMSNSKLYTPNDLIEFENHKRYSSMGKSKSIKIMYL